MKHIYRNFPWNENYSNESFLGVLHEQDLWDDDEYFLLEQSVYSACMGNNAQDPIPRDLAWPVMRIYSYLMLKISCYLDEGDISEITNITRDQVYARRSRVMSVFEGFFKGEMPEKEYLPYDGNEDF